MENKPKELKVKSFRVDEDTFSKFKEIASTEFGNQSQCLEALINIYETEEAKSILVGRQLEIESFQDYLNKINKLFTMSLQLSSDAEDRAKETFYKKIEALEDVLAITKEKNKESLNSLNKFKEENKELKIKFSDIEKKNQELIEMKDTLSQLANRNLDLANKFEKELEIYKAENIKMKDLEKDFLTKDREVGNYKSDISLYKVQVSELELQNNKFNNTINEKDKEIQSYKALIESIQKDYDTRIITLENKLKKEYKAEKERELKLIEKEFDLARRELEFEIRELKAKQNK